jgi:predicted alpha/beta superfamily hydrolase
MHRRLFRLAAVAALLGAPLAATAQSTPPPYAIPNSEVRVLPPDAAGRHYQLLVGLPASYAKEPGRRYPVVYITDGYWDFAKVTAIHGCLVYDRVVPEFVTVGIGYAGENPNYDQLRRWELTPVSLGDDGGASGHAAEFLRTIETVILPFVDREYRVDPSYRVLGGASLGGLFTLYAMYTKPELFEAYVAVTPAVVVGNDWLLGYEDAFAKSGRRLDARLHVSAGGNESPAFLGGTLRFNQRVASRRYPGFAYAFRIVDGERHAGMQLEGYTRGLRFAFEPLAPETGPSTRP